MSRRHLWVEYRDEAGALLSRSLLFPAIEANLTTLDLLFQQLYQSWLEHRLDTEALVSGPEWQLVRAISSLLPSAPGMRLHLKWLRQDLALFADLFLHDGDSQPGKLVQLNRFDPPARQPWQEGTPITLADLPFPTSGSRHADAIALQLYHFNAPDGRTVHRWLDAQTRYGVQVVLQELSKPEDERISDYLKQVYEANLIATPELEEELFDFED